jgi:hypothetical protein
MFLENSSDEISQEQQPLVDEGSVFLTTLSQPYNYDWLSKSDEHAFILEGSLPSPIPNTP